MEEEEYSNIVGLAVELHNKVKERQELLSRTLVDYTKLERELMARRGKMKARISSLRDSLAMMRQLVGEKRKELAQRKQLANHNHGVGNVSGVEDNGKVVPFNEVCDSSRNNLGPREVQIAAHCQEGNHKERESSARQQKRTRLMEADNNCDDRDQMWAKLMQLKKAINVTEPEVEPSGHPETGGALTTFSSKFNQPRPTNWVLALHQEAKREALRLAYRNIGNTTNIYQLRIEDETEKFVRFSERVETSDGSLEVLKLDNQWPEREEALLSTRLKRAIEE